MKLKLNKTVISLLKAMRKTTAGTERLARIEDGNLIYTNGFALLSSPLESETKLENGHYHIMVKGNGIELIPVSSTDSYNYRLIPDNWSTFFTFEIGPYRKFAVFSAADQVAFKETFDIFLNDLILKALPKGVTASIPDLPDQLIKFETVNFTLCIMPIRACKMKFTEISQE